jgi:hypothetical protein
VRADLEIDEAPERVGRSGVQRQQAAPVLGRGLTLDRIEQALVKPVQAL